MEEHENIFLDIDGLNNPKGLVVIDNTIVVVDSENNRLVFFNKDTNKIEKIVGKTGNKKGEFLFPEGISVDSDKNLYVADCGNQRIQKLDTEGNVIDIIEVDIFEKVRKGQTSLKDIEVDSKGNIYLSVKAFNKKQSCIYIVDEDKKIKKIGKGLTGYFAKNNDQIYFLSELEYYKEESGEGFQSGDNFLVKLENGKFKEGYYLPRRYSPKGMVIVDKRLFVVGGAANSVDEFTLEGEHVKTIYRDIITVEEMDSRGGIIKEYITADEDGNLFVSDVEVNKILKIKNK